MVGLALDGDCSGGSPVAGRAHGKMFDTEVTVTQTQSRATGADHDEFLLRFGTPA